LRLTFREIGENFRSSIPEVINFSGTFPHRLVADQIRRFAGRWPSQCESNDAGVFLALMAGLMLIGTAIGAILWLGRIARSAAARGLAEPAIRCPSGTDDDHFRNP
jgi:hypothetical protein